MSPSAEEPASSAAPAIFEGFDGRRETRRRCFSQEYARPHFAFLRKRAGQAVSSPAWPSQGPGGGAFIDASRMSDLRPRLDTQAWRESITRGFIRVEDVVYVGLGTLLAAIALVLLVAAAVAFVQALLGETLPDRAVELLDRILLILMIVELLYTVQVSFREHALMPEPFLIVGLIAAIRRVLVLTAEFARLLERNEGAFLGAMLELGLLTVMIVALVVSLVALKKHPAHGVADRA